MSRAARSPVAGRAQVAIAGGALGDDAVRALAARGLIADRVGAGDAALVAAVERGALVATNLDDEPGAAQAAALTPACRLAAEAGRPLVVLVPPGRRRGGGAGVERAAALAMLRAQGAVVLVDPDAWLEAICLLARSGLPSGPRTAVVAAPGSWLEASARAQAAEADGAARAVSVVAVAADAEPADVALIDRGAMAEVPAVTARGARALVVPVIARGELVADDGSDDGALVGLRAALAAVAACGRAGERIVAGLGPAPVAARGELDVDEERVARQLDKVLAGDRRLGDHEAKVMLAAYGVAITRQAVATTPSSATRIAKKAGYPVEIKPWGTDAPSERAGCPVERGIATASEVRRAFIAVLGAIGLPSGETEGAAVIVRETPPAGREVAVSIVRVGVLGWTVVVEVAGAGPIAAPAPLRVVDAAAVAAAVTATRAGEPEPDRVALANLLRRASHLAVDQDARFERIELGRVIAAPKGARTMVVDAEILLRS